jgi:hypothetical protein
MRTDFEATRVDTCFPEAAHAVFDYFANFEIRWVYVTDELEAMCVSALPVEPLMWQAMNIATGLFAGEEAVDRRHGERRPYSSFDEFASEVWLLQEEDPDGSLGLLNCDATQAMKMLERVASWPDNPWGNIEKCYRFARKTAALDVDCMWPQICCVAERLVEVGYLDGEECVQLIESAGYGEEQHA